MFMMMMIRRKDIFLFPVVFALCHARTLVTPTTPPPYVVPPFPHGQVGSNPYCFDNITDCHAYIEHNSTICNPGSIYYPWVTTHCQASCGVCKGGPTTTLQPCVDALSYCNLYTADDCIHYPQWAKKNCIKTCHLCNELVLHVSKTTTIQPPAVG